MKQYTHTHTDTQIRMATSATPEHCRLDYAIPLVPLKIQKGWRRGNEGKTRAEVKGGYEKERHMAVGGMIPQVTYSYSD